MPRFTQAVPRSSLETVAGGKKNAQKSFTLAGGGQEDHAGGLLAGWPQSTRVAVGGALELSRIRTYCLPRHYCSVSKSSVGVEWLAKRCCSC